VERHFEEAVRKAKRLEKGKAKPAKPHKREKQT